MSLKPPRVLFWNLNKKDLIELVCDAVKASQIDIVVLIENSRSESKTLDLLKSKVSPTFYMPASTPGRFQLFSREASYDLIEMYADDRISLRRLKFSGTDISLGLVHLVDKMNWDPMNQSAQVQLLAHEIHEREEKIGHDRTILIGDFNMNPFDQAMNMATGLNALMTKRCVERGSRTLQGREYRYFYNPMWGLFGDRTPGPAGTYYHTTGSQGVFGWNMLDQVLIRPSAIESFSGVEILHGAGTTSLKTPLDRPDKRNASDHFPILLSLK